MTLFQTVYVAPLHGSTASGKTFQIVIPHIYDGFWFMLLIQVSVFICCICLYGFWVVGAPKGVTPPDILQGQAHVFTRCTWDFFEPSYKGKKLSNRYSNKVARPSTKNKDPCQAIPMQWCAKSCSMPDEEKTHVSYAITTLQLLLGVSQISLSI